MIDTPSGTGPGTLRYHVDPTSSAAAVTNWDTASATVTIRSTGLTPVQSTMTFQRQLPDITMLTPTQVLPNTAATLTLSGRGLSQVDDLSQITIGGQSVASGSILSDTQAVVTLAASTAGNRQVRVSNALGQAAAQAQVAVAASGYAYASVPNPSAASLSAMVFAPSRATMFVASYYASALQRYTFDGTTWTLASMPWAGAWRVQLSPDRQTLYVLGTNGLAEVDPDTLATRKVHPEISGFHGFAFDHPLPLTSDLRLWAPEGTAFLDLRHGTVGNPDWTEFAGVATDELTATPDGAHLYTVDGSVSPPPVDGWYSAVTHTSTALAPTMLLRNYRASFDDKGTIGVFEGSSVYRTADWSLVGLLKPASGNFNYPNGVMSPDGRRIYVLTAGVNDFHANTIAVYDTTQLQAGTSNLVLLGTIAVADPGAICALGQGDCDPIGRLAIDPTGTTLFWGGNNAFTVIPIPGGLASPNAVPTRALRAIRKAATTTRTRTAH